MLHYNYNRIFKARGVERPFSFLLRAGFPSRVASNIKNNKTLRIDLKYLERLCIVLRCTPNDLLEWTPNPDENIDDAHPIHTIRKKEKVVNLTKTFNSIPIDKLEEIEQMITKKLQDKE